MNRAQVLGDTPL